MLSQWEEDRNEAVSDTLISELNQTSEREEPAGCDQCLSKDQELPGFTTSAHSSRTWSGVFGAFGTWWVGMSVQVQVTLGVVGAHAVSVDQDAFNM